MLASLEFTFNEGALKNKELSQGQGGLFDDNKTLEYMEKTLPKIAERPRVEILAWEKESFGFYMSGNPLDEFAEKFSGFVKISEIQLGNFYEGQLIRIGGIILDVRQIKTKKGELMANFTLEDFSGKIGVTVFSSVFSQCIDYIFADEVVVVSGKVDNSGERIKIIAEEIIPAQDYIPDIYLNVPENLSEEVLNLLKKNSGESAAYFKIDGKWRKQDFKVSSNENFYNELKNLIGEENFRIY